MTENLIIRYDYLERREKNYSISICIFSVFIFFQLLEKTKQ